MSMHKDSCLCVDSSYDYFNVPPTDVTSRESFYSKTYPIGNVGHGGPLEFALKSNKADYIDLSQTFLELSLKILKANGTAPVAPAGGAAVAPASKVFPVNYVSAALFKDVEVYIGNKLISSSDGHYPYKAFIELILSFRKSVLESFGKLGGYYKDDNDYNDVTDFGGADHNTGAKARFDLTKFGRSFQLICKVHNDLFNQYKKFPGDIDIKIRFIRNEEDFALMAHTPTQLYKIEIEDAVLHVKRSTLEEVFLNEIDNARKPDKLMKFPYRRVELKYSTQGPNKSILQENRMISNGELPKRIIVGLIDARAFDGHLNHNPFNFQNFGLTDIVLQRGKDISPFCEMSKLDYVNNKFFEAYLAMIYGTGRLFANDPVSISPDDFKSGAALYCFDLSKNGSNAHSFELSESGTINVIATLAAPVAHGIVMIMYNEFDSMLALGPSNQPEVISSLL